VGRARQAKRLGAITDTIMAKYFSSRLAMKVATDAVQVYGGNGCYNKYPVERLFREAKILEIIEGTTQLHQELIATSVLNEYQRSRR
jgi:alkylation response protein AidB-like acyl-CoA dehydrogenase